VLAAVKDAARRAKGAVAKRPSLTAAARDASRVSGRDEETASFSRTKKPDKVGLTAYRRKAKGRSTHTKQRRALLFIELRGFDELFASFLQKRGPFFLFSLFFELGSGPINAYCPDAA